MKTKTRRVLALVCSAFLLVVMTISATVAYLKDDDKVVNTFTVGKVKISLDEAALVDEYGKKDDSKDRVKENDYKLLPGHTYDKDPTVKVLAKSEDCYVRALVTVTNKADLDELFKKYGITDVSTVVTGTDTENWELKGLTYGDNSIIYEVRYKSKVEYKETDQELKPVFTQIKVPNDFDGDDLKNLEGMKINVVAQAIQADGFANADAAWAAFEGKTSDSNT